MALRNRGLKSEQILFALTAYVFTAYSPLLGAQQETQQISDALRRYDAKDAQVKAALADYAALEENIKKIEGLDEKIRNDILWEVGGTFFDCDCEPGIAKNQNPHKNQPVSKEYIYARVHLNCKNSFGWLWAFSKKGAPAQKAVAEALGFIVSWNRVKYKPSPGPEAYAAANMAYDLLAQYRQRTRLTKGAARIDQLLKTAGNDPQVFERKSAPDSHPEKK